MKPVIYDVSDPADGRVKIGMGNVVIPFIPLKWGGMDGDKLISYQEGSRYKPNSQQMESSDVYWVPSLDLVVAMAKIKMTELRREFLIDSLRQKEGQGNLERAQRIHDRLREAKRKRNMCSQLKNRRKPTTGQLTLFGEDR